jgi:hypothetical protein
MAPPVLCGPQPAKNNWVAQPHEYISHRTTGLSPLSISHPHAAHQRPHSLARSLSLTHTHTQTAHPTTSRRSHTLTPASTPPPVHKVVDPRHATPLSTCDAPSLICVVVVVVVVGPTPPSSSALCHGCQ